MIVVDASIAFKWIKSKKERHVDKAYKLLELHLDNKQKILVPNLLFIEMANALITKSSASKKAIKIDLKKLFDLNLKVYIPTHKNILDSGLLAKKHHTSVYDMLYAVIAKNNKTTLITADKRFARKTNFKFVKLLKDIKTD